MKIFFSILLNASILYIIYILLNTDSYYETYGVNAVTVEWWWALFLLWWTILWFINYFIRPILKLIWLPFFFLFYWIVILIINWIVLWLFEETINNILKLPDFKYVINWGVNFIIAVAIFSFLNMLYSILFNKK